MPKSNKIWVFGSTGGYSFTDSPKYVFNYTFKNHPETTPIWLTHSPKVLSQLRAEGKRVHFINSAFGIWYSLRARYGIVSHGLTDINRFCVAKLSVIECWHGIPLKPVLLSDPKIEMSRKMRKIRMLRFVFPFLYKQIRYDQFEAICGSGEVSNQILRRIFGHGAVITDLGFPRLDGLFNLQSNLIVNQINTLKINGSKVGIYMPTYRREGEFDIVQYFADNLDSIHKSLQKSDSYLFVKMHTFENHQANQPLTTDRIYFIENDQIDNDIYSVLGLFDYLITDYSSVIFDFFILEKPIFLLTPDRLDYISSNGDFIFDYMELELDVFESWEEYLVGIDLRRTQNTGHYRELKNKFHKYHDNNNSKRLYQYLTHRD